MSENAAPSLDGGQPGEPSPLAFSRTIDWAIGAVLGVFGALIALCGGALYAASSHAVVTDVIRNGEFESDVLTEAEAIDLLVALGQWSGVGLVVTGLLLVALGVGVVVLHGRVREADEPTPAWVLGVAGAIVGGVLSFVPLSPVLGGATAGYLDSDQTASGLGTGTLAGVFGSLPVLVVTVFSGIGLFVGVPGELAPAAAALLAFTAVLTLLYFVALSAIGGYLGAWARKRGTGA
jgi:hypothetical protein